MRRIILLLLASVMSICFFTLQLNAQVTVGSGLEPEKAAILDLKTEDGIPGSRTTTRGGLLLPRVELLDLTELNIFESITIYDSDYAQQKLNHIGLTVFNLTENSAQNLERGIYVWDGEKWGKTTPSNKLNFFYMPSIVIDTRITGNFTIDLYQEYVRQFQTPAVRSFGAPTSIPFYMTPQDLYYYVTDFDQNVFSNINITDQGLMTFDVIQPSTDGTSFMNIVFVMK